MPDWIQTGITHYQKQLPSELNFTLTTPEAQKRKGKNIEQIKQLSVPWRFLGCCVVCRVRQRQ
jgi:23S rRNA pseudoU1915 N3-methylase RlmH